jgi:acetate kinase
VLRARICDALRGFGVELDAGANEAHAPHISSPRAACACVVEPTNEEWVAASHALALVRRPAHCTP